MARYQPARIRIIPKELLPDDWSTETIQELLDDGSFLNVQDGNHGGDYPQQDDFVADGIPLIRGNNLINGTVSFNDCQFITERKAETLRIGFAEPGDVLLTHKGTMGKTAIVPHFDKWKYIVLNPQITLYRVSKQGRIDKNYLKYFFDSPDFQQFLENISGMSTISTLSLVYQKNLELPFPSLPEQRAIAGILRALDDKIELNRRTNVTLESMARAVFRQWFVEGEEVGKWKVGRLGDVIKVNERSINNKTPFTDIEYIDISSVSIGHLANTTTYPVTKAPSRAKRLVKHGDTIWSTVRPNRKSYLFISDPKDNLIVSTGFAVLTPVDIPPSYLYLWVTTDSFVDYLVSNADGSAYPAVSANRFSDAEILLPPKKILDNFENIIGILLVRIAHNEKESRTLASLRDSLLPKLMSGEVRVKDVEGL